MTRKDVVLVTSRSFGSGEAPVLRQLADAGLQVVRGSTSHDLTELRPLLTDVVGWIAGTAPVTREHLTDAPQLRVLARYGVGVDSVDLVAAAERGVVVTNTPAANSDAVADLAIALLLAVLRGVTVGDRSVRSHSWQLRRGRELGKQTLGVIGLGRIGQAVVRRVQGFGTTVVGHDPYLEAARFAELGVRHVELDDIGRLADAVSLHVPGGHRLIDQEWLNGVKPGLVLVNTARADLIDEAAVAAALHTGQLAAYAADTLAAESAGGTSPLLAPELADRVVVTPHLGAQTIEAVDRMGTTAVRCVLDVLAGREPPHAVPPPAHTPQETTA